ncbi:hypothetical protein HDU81_010765 [Chytriomyces hyalinus]|nr:hypothetical protein HDU81_010765 [Chytriomyces hyalinus]
MDDDEDDDAVQPEFMLRRSTLRKSESRINDLDIRFFKSYLNDILSDQKDLFARGTLPLLDEPADSLFNACKDGFLLARIINFAVPGSVDEAKLHAKPRHVLKQAENLGIVLAAAREVGVRMSSIGPNDILAGNATVILGVIWQLIKMCQAVHNPDLQHRLNESVQLLKQKDQELEEQKRHIATLEKDLQTATSKITDLNLEMEQSETLRLEQSRREKVELDAMKGNVQTVEERNRELERLLEARDAEIRLLREQLVQAAVTINNANEELCKTSASVSAKDEQILELQCELARQGTLLETKQQEQTMQLQERDIALQKLKDDHHQQLADLSRSSNADLQLNTTSAFSEEDLLVRNNRKLIEKNAMLMTKLLAANAELAGCNKLEESVKDQADKFKTALVELQSKLDAHEMPPSRASEP